MVRDDGYKPDQTLAATRELLAQHKPLACSVSSAPARDKVLAQLEKMNDYDAGGFRLSFSPANRVGSRFVEITVIGPAGKLMR